MPSSTLQNLRFALRDLKEGIGAVYIWSTLGLLDIKQRYRRSLLGPFWLTISAGTLIAVMGPLYSKLFGLEMSDYMPYLAVSYVVWVFMAGLTGMTMRLAFAISTSVPADIILMDEWLAVGDVGFSREGAAAAAADARSGQHTRSRLAR